MGTVEKDRKSLWATTRFQTYKNMQLSLARVETLLNKWEEMSGKTWNSHAKNITAEVLLLIFDSIVEHCSSIGDELVSTTSKDHD